MTSKIIPFLPISKNIIFSLIAMLGVPYVVMKTNKEKSKHMRRAILSSTKNWMVGFPINYLFFRWAIQKNIIEKGKIPLNRFIKEVLLQLLFIDTWFYWAHRLLHTKMLYFLHKEHHSFNPTTTMSYVAMSIPEYLTENIGYSIGGPLLCKTLGSKLNARSWTFANALVAFWAAVFHSNSLSFSLKKFNINGPKEHHVHHANGLKNYNFSLLFLHWDILMGTYKVKDTK
jgi:sterol desaturase/sphingolipid hydroxylase (fatty acid hydroxylase superfamily)